MAKTRRLTKKVLNESAASIEKITIKTLDYGFVVKVGCKTIAIDSFQELMDSLAFYLIKHKEAEKELYSGSRINAVGIIGELHRFTETSRQATNTLGIMSARSGRFRPEMIMVDDKNEPDTATCYGCDGDVEDYGGLYITPDGAKPMCKRCFNKLKESETQYMNEELKDEPQDDL